MELRQMRQSFKSYRGTKKELEKKRIELLKQGLLVGNLERFDNQGRYCFAVREL